MNVVSPDFSSIAFINLTSGAVVSKDETVEEEDEEEEDEEEEEEDEEEDAGGGSVSLFLLPVTGVLVPALGVDGLDVSLLPIFSLIVK